MTIVALEGLRYRQTISHCFLRSYHLWISNLVLYSGYLNYYNVKDVSLFVILHIPLCNVRISWAVFIAVWNNIKLYLCPWFCNENSFTFEGIGTARTHCKRERETERERDRQTDRDRDRDRNRERQRQRERKKKTIFLALVEWKENAPWEWPPNALMNTSAVSYDYCLHTMHLQVLNDLRCHRGIGLWAGYTMHQNSVLETNAGTTTRSDWTFSMKHTERNLVFHESCLYSVIQVDPSILNIGR